MQKCKECGYTMTQSECRTCHGEGELESQEPMESGIFEKCYMCNGTGLGFYNCPNCDFEDEV